MVKSSKIYKAINEVENKAKKSIIEFFKLHNLTEMDFCPNPDFDDMDEDEYADYEEAISDCEVIYALGHARKWVELISLSKMEVKEEGGEVEFYCYGEHECSVYEGKDVELLPESYAEILEFLEAIKPYIEYYKNEA